MAIGPKEVRAAGVTAVELAFVGIVAVGAEPVVAEQSSGGVLSFEIDADPSRREFAGRSLS